jgi:alpha-glucosidase
MGIGSLLPFARGHSNKGTRDKEPWAFDADTTEACREALQRRYRLLPYLYTLFERSSHTGLPIASPAFFADHADAALRAEDAAFLLGDNLLVVTNTRPGSPRVPRLPRGLWREIDPPTHPDLPRLFLRAGAVLPTGPDIESTASLPADPLVLWIALDHMGQARGDLYEDDGDGWAFREGRFRRSRFVVQSRDGAVTLASAVVEGDLPPHPRLVIVRLLTDHGILHAVGDHLAPITLRTP